MRCFALLAFVLAAGPARGDGDIEIRRVPGDAIQPQVAVGEDGVVHLVYYRGEAVGGDLFHVRSKDGGKSFSEPLRVNSTLSSAVAAGTIRGAQVALGAKGRVHVAWNGAASAGDGNGAPMLYTRLDDGGAAFEPQRNLMTKTRILDGGGSVAADGEGNVYVVWHAAPSRGGREEADRAVWVARSSDGGATFAPERRANTKDTGACGCCGLRAFASRSGALLTLYRTATHVVARDMHLLVSKDRGAEFASFEVDAWNVPKCVMSLAAFAEGPQGIIAAWETEGRVHAGVLDLDALALGKTIEASGDDRPHKHPALACGPDGGFLLAWTEGTAWKRGGAVAWQLFDRAGKPVADHAGRRDGVPVWSFPAVFSTGAGKYVLLY